VNPVKRPFRRLNELLVYGVNIKRLSSPDSGVADVERVNKTRVEEEKFIAL